MTIRIARLITLACLLGMAILVPQSRAADVELPAICGRSPLPEHYGYVSDGNLIRPAVPESPDPLVAYRRPIRHEIRADGLGACRRYH